MKKDERGSCSHPANLDSSPTVTHIIHL